MKRYGIYLCFEPSASLPSQGLVRLLMAFLKGAREHPDIRFVIAGPSWFKPVLLDVCQSEGVDPLSFDILVPEPSLFLRIFKDRPRGKKRKKAKRKFPGLLFLKTLGTALYRQPGRVKEAVLRTRNPLLLPALLLYLVLDVVLTPLVKWVAILIGCPIWLAARLWKSMGERQKHKFHRFVRFNRSLLQQIKPLIPILNLPFVVRRFRKLILKDEIELVLRKIAREDDVIAWFSPTPFWPEFTRIDKPRLLCVPDVVLADFPVGFAVQNPGLLSHFERVRKTIQRSPFFVTYSNTIKWDTLVAGFHVPPASVFVIPHGASRVDGEITLTGFRNDMVACEAFCTGLVSTAMGRSTHPAYARELIDQPFRFLFYPSQFRPHKNVVTLLRAYEEALRHRFIGHKLILTGHPGHAPEVDTFILEHRLQNDVIYVPNLTAQELAAFYRMADIAISPSLFEGACPFTFTEALSVGTPVLLARIPVTEEVIDDPALREMMLFDPYDPQGLADRIAWAISHRDELLQGQLPLYRRLATRTWPTMVGDYVAALDRIASVHG